MNPAKESIKPGSLTAVWHHSLSLRVMDAAWRLVLWAKRSAAEPLSRHHADPRRRAARSSGNPGGIVGLDSSAAATTESLLATAGHAGRSTRRLQSPARD